jgi:hypothetical protein
MTHAVRVILTKNCRVDARRHPTGGTSTAARLGARGNTPLAHFA